MKQGPKQKHNGFLEAKPKIMACVCLHSFQDKAYGKGKRVHNPTAKGFKCTVCGSEKLS